VSIGPLQLPRAQLAQPLHCFVAFTCVIDHTDTIIDINVSLRSTNTSFSATCKYYKNAHIWTTWNVSGDDRIRIIAPTCLQLLNEKLFSVSDLQLETDISTAVVFSLDSWKMWHFLSVTVCLTNDVAVVTSNSVTDGEWTARKFQVTEFWRFCC